MNTSTEGMNPDICKIKVGARKIREITVYPLSNGDWKKCFDEGFAMYQGIITAMRDKEVAKAKERDEKLKPYTSGKKKLSEKDMLEIEKIDAALNGSSDHEKVGFVKEVIEFIQNNLSKIIKYAIDEGENPEDIIMEMTPGQTGTLVNTIFEQNYEAFTKNLPSLITKKIQGLLTP